jgi:Ca-activated chloride channel family protein
MSRSTRLLAITALIGTYSSVGQESPRPLSPDTRVDLVLVPVTLMDRRGALVTDLDRQHFTVLQDNNPRPIFSFSRENLPCSLGIVLDTSQSMYGQLSMAKTLTSEVLSISEPGDEAFLASASDKPGVLSSLTTDAASVQSLLPFVKPGGNTALVDTVYLTLTQLRKAGNPRKALLVVSDGMDNSSRHSKTELMRMAVETDVQIYTVVIGAPSRTAKSTVLREEREGLAFLSDLAENTGGISYSVEFLADAHRVAGELGRALRDQYIIGYTPERASAAPQWHKIQIKLDVPKISVYARSGYYFR